MGSDHPEAGRVQRKRHTVKIWVDGDGCPAAVREQVLKTAERRKLPVCVVADRWLNLPRMAQLELVVVQQGADAADMHIADGLEEGDLVITQDIPLAAVAVEKGAVAIEPRGQVLDADTVGSRLSMRDFREELMSGGEQLGGPRPFGKKDRERFAAALDRALTRLLRARS